MSGGHLENEGAQCAYRPPEEPCDGDALEDLERDLDHDEGNDDDLEPVGGAHLQLGGDGVEKVVDNVQPLVEHLEGWGGWGRARYLPDAQLPE